jgi:antitoxin ParD1/3/4
MNASTAEGDLGKNSVTPASEIVRACRLLKEREAKVAALRAALDEAEQSGEPELFDFDEFVRETTHPGRPMTAPAAGSGGPWEEKVSISRTITLADDLTLVFSQTARSRCTDSVAYPRGRRLDQSWTSRSLKSEKSLPFSVTSTRPFAWAIAAICPSTNGVGRPRASRRARS